MSAGRLAEALAPFVTCGERYCDTFDNGNPNCDDCTRLRGLAVQRVLGLLDSDEARELGARALAITDDYDGCFERLDGTDPEEPMSTDEEDAEWWRVRANAVLAAIRTHLTTPTREENNG